MTPRHTISSQYRSTLTGATICGPFMAFAAILAVAVGTFEPPDASAYVLEGPKWPSGSTVVMQLSLGNAGRTLADGNTSWNSAVSPALDSWNQVIGGMQFGRVMNSTAAVAQGDGVNSMAFASTFFGSSFGSNTLAITGYYYRSSTMIEADIVFNNNLSWDSYRGSLRSGVYDIQRVALHESGHALGLAHSSLSTAIMYPYISSLYALSSDDISGAQSLYGPATSPTPTPTPTATPSATPTPSATATPTATPTPSPAAAVMLSPVPGSTFSSSSVTFSWSAGSATSYALMVGSSLNGGDIYSSGVTTAHGATVNTPTDGRTIYVSLYSNVNNSWLANKYTYHAFTTSPTPTPTPTPTPSPSATPSSSPAVTVSAAPTSIRSGGSATFTISASAPAAGPITVAYSMGGGAILNKHYSLSGTPGQVTIPSGASSATLTLTELTVGSLGKTATMTLKSGAGYSLSAPTSASVSLRR
jgi:Matrixin